MNLQYFFSIIQIDKSTSKAVLNESAKQIFLTKEEIEEFVKSINLNKKVEFIYFKKNLYVINILEDASNIYLLFSKIEDDSLIFSTLTSDNNVEDIYQKEILKEFLDKFLALKKRHGGFNIKFLYFKIDFVLNISIGIRKNLLQKFIKYIKSIIRSSDIIGQISENEFGIIITNSNKKGADIIISKITKYISDLNIEYGRRIIEVKSVLANEIVILKYSKFDKFIKVLNENSEFITVGIKLKELIK